MEFKREAAPLSQIKADLVVVGVFEDGGGIKQIGRLDRAFPAPFLRKITQLCTADGFKGKSGQFVQVPSYGALKCGKLILWGLGKSADSGPATVRKLAANVARRLPTNHAHKSACIYLRAEQSTARHVQAAVEGWLLGSYNFLKYKSGKEDQPAGAIEAVSIAAPDITAREFSRAATAGSVIAEATNLARSLIAEPPSYMTPTRLSQEARRVARECGLTVTVMNSAEAEKIGMGAFLGVARGAKEPPKFIVLKYRHPRAKRTIAVVGKGITFDSGGLSLKPAQSMENMKYDMSGAAAMIATMQAVGKLKPCVSVIGVAAVTENMPGGSALHPGDVLVAMNGKTIEVNNTDAEGRLILADALCYAARQNPDEIIDVATLTGACVTALGRVAAGILGNDQKLIDKLIEAGDEAGEKLWQLPLFDEYKEGLKSDIADFKNAGARGEAGASSAAMLLREFVDGKPWAHLDIAGPAWLEKEKDEQNKGGTAFGVRTLCRYILGQG